MMYIRKTRHTHKHYLTLSALIEVYESKTECDFQGLCALSAAYYRAVRYSPLLYTLGTIYWDFFIHKNLILFEKKFHAKVCTNINQLKIFEPRVKNGGVSRGV